MKILIDLTSLADNFSGIERYALNISKQMIIKDKKNKYILVFKNKIHPEFEKFKEQKNIKLKVIGGKNKLIFNQIILPYNLYKIKADKYMFLAFPSPILFLRKGIINTIHDLTCWDYPKTMKLLSRWYFRISITNAMIQSEIILTVSNFSKNRIINKFKNKKNIYVIYNGISEVFKNFEYNIDDNELVRKKYVLKDNYIMALGTLEPRKNLKLLIEAFIELKRENKINKKLVLVGRKGWKFECIVDGIDDDIKKDIFFTGFVEDKYLPYIYYNADFFVFPSLYEGFGIPVIEAIYMNTPVIISNIESLVEITNDNCRKFTSNNKNELKQSILEHINSSKSELESQIINCKNEIIKYKWEDESIKLINILCRESVKLI